MKTVICNKCGWAHFEVSKEYAENEIEKVNEYLSSLSNVEFTQYYGGKFSSIDKYNSCFRCGASYIDFHNKTETDNVPMGVTIQPILCKDEK